MVGRVLPFLSYGWISHVAINKRGNKAYVLIQKQSHLFIGQRQLFGVLKDFTVKSCKFCFKVVKITGVIKHLFSYKNSLTCLIYFLHSSENPKILH